MYFNGLYGFNVCQLLHLPKQIFVPEIAEKSHGAGRHGNRGMPKHLLTYSIYPDVSILVIMLYRHTGQILFVMLIFHRLKIWHHFFLLQTINRNASNSANLHHMQNPDLLCKSTPETITYFRICKIFFIKVQVIFSEK